MLRSGSYLMSIAVLLPFRGLHLLFPPLLALDAPFGQELVISSHACGYIAILLLPMDKFAMMQRRRLPIYYRYGAAANAQ